MVLWQVEKFMLVLGLKWNFCNNRKFWNYFLKLLFITLISSLAILLNILETDNTTFNEEDSWSAVFVSSEKFLNPFILITSYVIMILKIQNEIERVKDELRYIDEQFLKYGFSIELSTVNARTKKLCIQTLIINLLFIIGLFPGFFTIDSLLACKVTISQFVFNLINIYIWTWLKLCVSRINVINKYLRKSRNTEHSINDIIMIDKLSFSLIALIKRINSIFNSALLFICGCNYSVIVISIYLSLKMERKAGVIVLLVGSIRNMIQIINLSIVGYEITSKVSSATNCQFLCWWQNRYKPHVIKLSK